MISADTEVGWLDAVGLELLTVMDQGASLLYSRYILLYKMVLIDKLGTLGEVRNTFKHFNFLILFYGHVLLLHCCLPQCLLHWRHQNETFLILNIVT